MTEIRLSATPKGNGYQATVSKAPQERFMVCAPKKEKRGIIRGCCWY